MNALFCDTSGEKFVIGLIKNKKMVIFESIDVQQNVVKNAQFWIQSFFKKNKISLKTIDAFYITTGPGSFTGTKVAANVVGSFHLVFPETEIYTINSFDLFAEKNKSVALRISKTKFIVRKKYLFGLFMRIKFVSSEKLNYKKYIVSYSTQNVKKLITKKILNGSFKKNINPLIINLNYADYLINK